MRATSLITLLVLFRQLLLIDSRQLHFHLCTFFDCAVAYVNQHLLVLHCHVLNFHVMMSYVLHVLHFHVLRFRSPIPCPVFLRHCSFLSCNFMLCVFSRPGRGIVLTSLLCVANDYIHLLTSNARQKLRVDLQDFEGNTAYAKYDNFHVGTEEEQYKLLTVGKYSGTAGQCCVKTSTEVCVRWESKCMKWQRFTVLQELEL